MKDQPEKDLKEPQKKPYVKPEVRRVPLRPEEAVLGGCKVAGEAGPAQASCTDVVCSEIVS